MSGYTRKRTSFYSCPTSLVCGVNRPRPRPETDQTQATRASSSRSHLSTTCPCILERVRFCTAYHASSTLWTASQRDDTTNRQHSARCWTWSLIDAPRRVCWSSWLQHFPDGV